MTEIYNNTKKIITGEIDEQRKMNIYMSVSVILLYRKPLYCFFLFCLLNIQKYYLKQLGGLGQNVYVHGCLCVCACVLAHSIFYLSLAEALFSCNFLPCILYIHG